MKNKETKLEPLYEWDVPFVNGCFEGQTRPIKIYGTDETMNHEDSLKWAEDRNMRLMTKEELHLLCACGLLKGGMTSFWSASVVSNNRYGAWIFNGYIGSINNFWRFNSGYGAVRCLGR